PEYFVDVHTADVDLDVTGDVGDDRLDLDDGAGGAEHAAALTHPDRFALEYHRHLGRHGLRERDLLEIDVAVLGPVRMPFDDTRHRQDLLTVHVEIDQRVDPGLRAERGPQLAAIDCHVEGLHATSIDDGGHLSLPAQPARRP